QTAREIVRDINRLREALNLGVVAAISISSSFLGANSDALRGSATQTWPEVQPRSPWPLRSVLIVCVLAALAGGLAAGWYVHHRPSPLVVAPPEDAGQPKKPPITKEDEKEMQRQVQKYLTPTNRSEMVTGFTHAVELGLYYLK